MTPALERTTMRRESALDIGGVCRNLFGPVDHDQLSRDLKAKLKEIAEQDAHRWNFNFETNIPLPGRYQWEDIPSHSSPVLYLESTQYEGIGVSLNTEDSNSPCCHEESPLCNNEETLPVPCHVEINQENCSNISNTHKLPNEATPVRQKRAFSERVARHKTNAQITDFFVKRRRTSETKTSLNSFFTSSSEQTLRKRIR